MENGSHTAERPAGDAPAAAPTVVPVSAEQLAGLLGSGRPPASPAKRGPSFWVPVSILAVVGILAALAGSFMVGRSTGLSDDAVAAKVAKTRATDARKARTHESRALSEQKATLTAQATREMKRLNKLSYKKGRREGEASGYASGRERRVLVGQDPRHRGRQGAGSHRGPGGGLLGGLRSGHLLRAGTIYEYVWKPTANEARERCRDDRDARRWDSNP